jgi:hypothetical protein
MDRCIIVIETTTSHSAHEEDKNTVENNGNANLILDSPRRLLKGPTNFKFEAKYVRNTFPF